jgi:hypothetical protein
MVKNHGRSVSGDFEHIVGGVGMRFGEVCGDDLVDTILHAGSMWVPHPNRGFCG